MSRGGVQVKPMAPRYQTWGKGNTKHLIAFAVPSVMYVFNYHMGKSSQEKADTGNNTEKDACDIQSNPRLRRQNSSCLMTDV